MMSIRRDHFVRTGAVGSVGRFVTVDPLSFARGTRVICRSSRGLEVGEVISHPQDVAQPTPAKGSILRSMTAEDDFVWQRLNAHKDEAFTRCRELLRQHDRLACLIDAEILFDARHIFFYFLGEAPRIAAESIEQLAEKYEAEIRFAEFADAVEHGCGPDCGTEQGGGCGDSCSSCAVADACKSNARKKS